MDAGGFFSIVLLIILSIIYPVVGKEDYVFIITAYCIGILLLILTIWTFRRKHWIKGILLGILFIGWYWGGLDMRVFPGSQVYDSLKFTNHLVGSFYILGDPLYEYHSKRDWFGDGRSLTVYELPDNFVGSLEARLSMTRGMFPIKPNFRKNWEGTLWRKTPIQTKEQVFIEFVGSGFPKDSNFLGFNSEVRPILMTSGSFYAYFYNMHGNSPGDVDLFVISPQNDRIYRINRQT